MVAENETFLYGVLVGGGVPPYTLAVSGEVPSDPRIFYRAENFWPDDPVIKFGGDKLCGPGAGDVLCLFDRVSSGTMGMLAVQPDTEPQYSSSSSSAFRYAQVVSGCETNIAGSRTLNEIFANRAAEQDDEGVSFRASQIRLQGEFSWCGGYDDKSILAAIEMDLAPYVKTAPGDHDYLFTVTDAKGHMASTSATIRIQAEPIVLATAQATLTVGNSYTAADKLIDLTGGFGALSVDYADENRVPGMNLVGGQLEGSPSQLGEWTLALEVADQSGQSRVVSLVVAVEKDCGDPAVFSTPGTFTYVPPEGCSTIYAEAWGGGANGSAGDMGFDGSGGGGGAYASATISASASSYGIIVGAAGKDSSVREGATSLVLAKAGSGTNGGSKYQSIGDTTVGGGNGTMGGFGMNSGNGGDAGGKGGGVGGKWSQFRPGTDGQAPGGGGGAGGGGRASGAGAVGRVIIQARP